LAAVALIFRPRQECSQKWLTRVQLRDRVHDGEKMGGDSYRVPLDPVAPGAEVPEDQFVIIESMPVKSLITFPETNAAVTGFKTEVRGHAWAGDRTVKALDVSSDFGATWQPAALKEPANLFAWQQWSTEIEFARPGYYEIWARATDDAGVMQPFRIAWNPKGYLNNSMDRIALTVSG
jgi:hypothetical protein